MGSDPDILVDLTTAATSFEAEVMVEALRAQGIPAEAFTLAASMLQWDIAASQPFRVVVRRRDLESARAALQGLRADSVDIDWEDLDPGPREEPADVPEVRTTRILWRLLWLALAGAIVAGVVLARLGRHGNP